MRNAEIDRLVLSKCNDRWQKVARIIVAVVEELGTGNQDWELRTVARRVRILANKGQLLAAGNLFKWRRSEIKLPPASL